MLVRAYAALKGFVVIEGEKVLVRFWIGYEVCEYQKAPDWDTGF